MFVVAVPRGQRCGESWPVNEGSSTPGRSVSFRRPSLSYSRHDEGHAVEHEYRALHQAFLPRMAWIGSGSEKSGKAKAYQIAQIRKQLELFKL